jgi:plastocyanin
MERDRLMRKASFAILLISCAALVLGAQAATLAVTQIGQQFSSRTISAAVGDTVVFNNDDTVRHNIRILDEDDTVIDVGLQQPGEHLTYKFDKAGRFRARCGIHPSMKMTINVK